MIQPKDFYTHCKTVSLKDATGPIGTAVIKYEIRRYRDVRNLKDALAYQVRCSQRIVIPNPTPYPLGAQDVTSFSDYPAIVSNNVTITNSGGAETELLDYSPKTINSAVTKSNTDATGSMASTSHEHSSGSSTSQSNTFGASASIGFFGDLLTGGVSVSDSQTTAFGQSNSRSSGGSSGTNRSDAGGESMSVKDWGCNTYLDDGNSSPTWVWGQQYPWDVVKFNNAGVAAPTEDSPITLPQFLIPLLCDDTQALPPSQLSLFGIDFRMESVWVVRPGGNCQISFEHDLTYFSASHSYVKATATTKASVNAYIGNPRNPVIPPAVIDLCSYGLDPIRTSGRKGSEGAIIGFIPSKFIVPPAPISALGGGKYGATPFKTISGSNNLLITDTSDYSKAAAVDVGAGFTASETALWAKFSTNCAALSMTVGFKIADTTEGYELFLKHWKTGPTGVMLSIVVNGDTDHPITKYVDSLEAEGAEKNLLSISLRNLDYGSVDFHDYLKLGFNEIVITASPIGGSANAGDCGYKVRAISLERA